MSSTAEVIRARRSQRRISQERLAELTGVHQRQIARYESGEQAPTLPVAVRLAQALGVSLSELAGTVAPGMDLSGDWWAAWQTWGKGEVERIDVHELQISQDGEFLTLDGGSRARTVAEGSYSWRGELRLWDSEALMGWYRATDEAVRSKGTMYFALHPHGRSMAGSWTGLSYAGLIVRGWAAITRERAEVEPLIGSLIEHRGNLAAWPTNNS
jgi:transcriptional regulator with XRE-family HTH domain